MQHENTVLVEFPAPRAQAADLRGEDTLTLLLALEWAGMDLLRTAAALRARWLAGEPIQASSIERALAASSEASGAIAAWKDGAL